MVIDGFPGIVGVILMPHQVHDNLIGKYLVGIHNEYEQNVELFCGQGDFLLMDNHTPVFQTDVSVSYTHLDVYKRQGVHPTTIRAGQSRRATNHAELLKCPFTGGK